MREKILTYIERNSRVDLKDLAIMLGTDEAAVANEIADMEKEGVICGYHTLIDWDKTSSEKVTALIEVKVTDNTEDIFLATKFGMSIRFKETDARITGRVSYGVIGMKLDEGDEVIGMQMASQGEYMLVASEKGYGKRTRISEFKLQLRGGKGLLCYNVTEKTGNLVGMKLLDDGRDIMLITNEGILIRMGVDDISVIGRNTSGVKLMSIDADSDVRVASIAKVRESSRQDEEENMEDPENPENEDEETTEE